MNICLFDKNELNMPIPVQDERVQHLIKILHKKEGDTFSAGIIDGQAGHATITSIKNEKLTFEFTPESDGKPLHNLAMIIGFPRPIQLKRLLRDMAALGVCEVHLSATELTEKSYLNSELAQTDAGRKMLLDGTVQAASTHVPEISRHDNLKEAIRDAKQKHPEAKLLALDNVSPSESLWNSIAGEGITSAIAAIGSERGWTNKERQMLKDEGFELLSMGNRVMRTETAATVAASLILGSMGKLN